MCTRHGPCKDSDGLSVESWTVVVFITFPCFSLVLPHCQDVHTSSRCQKFGLLQVSHSTSRATIAPTPNSGTSTGFGRQLVFETLDRGEFVIATARNLEDIQDFPKSDKIRLLELDLTWDAQKIKAKIDDAVAFFGRVDVLVNNAGAGFKGISEELGYGPALPSFSPLALSILTCAQSRLFQAPIPDQSLWPDRRDKCYAFSYA